MPHLSDTGILLRFANPKDPLHALVASAVRLLRSRGEALYYTQQNRREFWNACTRPANVRGGLGLSIAQTVRRLQLIDTIFQRLPEAHGTGLEWDRLVTTHSVRGAQVHDAQLVAEMHVRGITHLLTLNPQDFARYPGITTVHPGDVK